MMAQNVSASPAGVGVMSNNRQSIRRSALTADTGEVAHQCGVGNIARVCYICRGSSASRNPSPSRLNDSTSRKIDSPGQIAIQGALST